MLDQQMAAQLGQQSSQPGLWAEPKRGDSNENLAYYLAMLASSPAAQNPFNVQSGQAESIQGYGLPGITPESSGADILSSINTGMGALNTGLRLYGAGSNLYNALYGGNNLSDITDVGSAITNANLAGDWASIGSVPSIWDTVNAADLFNTGFVGF